MLAVLPDKYTAQDEQVLAMEQINFILDKSRVVKRPKLGHNTIFKIPRRVLRNMETTWNCSNDCTNAQALHTLASMAQLASSSK